jgi:Cof subfamily protein (haloacid dehalogenase superfamily)
MQLNQMTNRNQQPTRTPIAPIRIVFADIDGTLAGESGKLSDRTVAALRGLARVNCELVLCTGCSRRAGQRFADELRCGGLGIVLNGAVTVDWESGRILRSSLLSQYLVGPAAAMAAEHGLSCVWLGDGDRSDRHYVQPGPALPALYEARNRDCLEVVSSLSAIPEAPASLVAYGTEAEVTALAEVWQSALGPGVHIVAGPTAAYQAWYAQITSGGANKALAAEYIANEQQTPRENTMAIGDHRNDVELLKWSGFGVCVAGGHPDALAAADFVTLPASEDGAAIAIEQFVLSSPKV